MFIRRTTSFINGIFDLLKLQIKFVDVDQTEKKILREKAGRKICFGMTFQGLVSLGQRRLANDSQPQFEFRNLT